MTNATFIIFDNKYYKLVKMKFIIGISRVLNECTVFNINKLSVHNISLGFFRKQIACLCIAQNNHELLVIVQEYLKEQINIYPLEML